MVNGLGVIARDGDPLRDGGADRSNFTPTLVSIWPISANTTGSSGLFDCIIRKFADDTDDAVIGNLSSSCRIEKDR